MLEYSPTKVAHVIIKSREFDAIVATSDGPCSASDTEVGGDAVRGDDSSDAARIQVAEFFAELKEDEQTDLDALAWVGRGPFSAEELTEAVEMARAERTSPTQDYLLGIPLLADYLEEGLEKLGYSVESVEDDML